MLQVKNKVIGEGKPIICVSVLDRSKEEILTEIKRLVDEKIEMIEWRVDAFEGVASPNAVRGVLSEAASMIENVIFVFTFRSKEQGGMCSLSKDEIYDLHQVAAESKLVDFIDLEYFYTEDADAEVYELQKLGTKVIASHHDFHETPSSDVIFMLLDQMKHSGADIVKLALMPQTAEDVLSLLSETNHFHKSYPEQPIITMSMGKLGAISRVSGEFFGSCVTFGAGKQSGAPGQIEMEKLAGVLEALSLA